MIKKVVTFPSSIMFKFSGKMLDKNTVDSEKTPDIFRFFIVKKKKFMSLNFKDF
jgi:hypothetical protein